jgi:hypothetical protein
MEGHFCLKVQQSTERMDIEPTAASSKLVLSTSKGISHLLILCAACLFMTTWLSYHALVAARHINKSLILDHSRLSASLFLDLDTPDKRLASADLHIAQMTDAFFGEECEVGHIAPCDDPSNSDAVNELRRNNPPPTAALLLSQYSYSSLYHLFKDLSVRGKDDEILYISSHFTSDSSVGIDSLSHFATDWYLASALDYVTHFRESDAIKQYRLFAGVLRTYIKQGNWLSLPGIDSTDLPVLTDIFCSGGPDAANDLCVVGILRAIAKISSQNNPRDLESGIPISDFLSSYSNIDKLMQSTPLVRYLSLWQWDGSGEPRVVPKDLTPAQASAWHYALGVVLRENATKLKSRTDCERLTDKALREFGWVKKQRDDYFANPGTDAESFLLKNKDQLCQPNRIESAKHGKQLGLYSPQR